MAVAPPTVSPGRSVDATGRALPMADEEIFAWAAEIAKGLDVSTTWATRRSSGASLMALIEAIDEGAERVQERMSHGFL